MTKRTWADHLEERRQEFRAPAVAFFNTLTVEQQLMEFVHAVADALPYNPARDRFGRALDRPNCERLQRLSLALDTPSAYDTAEQVGSIARALAHHLRDTGK